jgi:hypothetical protein
MAGWKETFPAGKDVPLCPVKGRVSEDTRPRLSSEKAARYPDATGPALSVTLQPIWPRSNSRQTINKSVIVFSKDSTIHGNQSVIT